MGYFSEKINKFFEADAPPMPPPGGGGGMGGGGLGGGGLGGGGLGGGLGGGGMPPPPMGGGLGGGLGGGMGGPGGGAGGGQPPETKFINIDDVWQALRIAVKDMEEYPELKLKTSSKKRDKSRNDKKSSLETGDSSE